MSPTAINDDDGSFAGYKLGWKKERQPATRNVIAASIDNLPVELLTQIFIQSTRAPHGFLLPSITIAQVCRFWREIALNTPHIWQYISLDDCIRPIQSSHNQAIIAADRSRDLPLDIHINLSDTDALLPILSPLLAHIRRWGRVTLTGQLQEDIDFTSFARGGSQALLDTLSINIKGLEPLVGLAETHSPRKTFECNPLTELAYTLRFHRVVMHAEVVSLPIPQRMTAIHLQSLVVREDTTDVIPDPAELVRFLQCCPDLRIFHYLALPHEPTYKSALERPPIVPLHRLHTLVLRSTCAVRAILSHLDTPALRKLYLEHTNMEFELRRASAYSRDHEDGDSDDEAHDFSQSPCSDFSTGMGLRNLLRRSNPPLEVLQMDYADMRTKDFTWCFDKLVSLQEFRIVASDMSDKVISLLEPSSSSLDDPEGRPRLRMPNLSVLELCNCQRLTGNAIVKALGARAQYTDRIADRNAYSRLSNVAIVACANFHPDHSDSLRRVLGVRLRSIA